MSDEAALDTTTTTEEPEAAERNRKRARAVADPARRGILRPSNLRATGERLERRQDGRLDVALERVALLVHRPVRAQRVEEARPDRTCVADEDPERDREGGVRWHKSMSVSCAVFGFGATITRSEKW